MKFTEEEQLILDNLLEPEIKYLVEQTDDKETLKVMIKLSDKINQINQTIELQNKIIEKLKTQNILMEQYEPLSSEGWECLAEDGEVCLEEDNCKYHILEEESSTYGNLSNDIIKMEKKLNGDLDFSDFSGNIPITGMK